MLLKDKNALIFGAGGNVGCVVSREFAKEGARVYLSGRRLEPIEQVANSIREAGGHAFAEQVDAMDADHVKRYVETVSKESGRIDVVFNAVSPSLAVHDEVSPATEISVDSFLASLTSRPT